MSKIPTRVQAKADAIREALAAGQSWRDFKGKRLRHDRTVVSIPIGRRWRMVLRDGDLDSIRVMSHEAYSRAKPG